MQKAGTYVAHINDSGYVVITSILHPVQSHLDLGLDITYKSSLNIFLLSSPAVSSWLVLPFVF